MRIQQHQRQSNNYLFFVAADVKRNIASFFDVDDYLNFSLSSTVIRQDLCLHIFPPYQLLSEVNWPIDGFDVICPIPMFATSNDVNGMKTIALSLTFTVKVLRLGKLCILGQRKGEDISSCRCVWESSDFCSKTNNSSINAMKLSFFTKNNEVYYLCGKDISTVLDGHSSRGWFGRYFSLLWMEPTLSICDLQVRETYFHDNHHNENLQCINKLSLGNTPCIHSSSDYNYYNDDVTVCNTINNLIDMIYDSALTSAAQSLLARLINKPGLIEECQIDQFLQAKGIMIDDKKNNISLEKIHQLSNCLRQDHFYRNAVQSIAQHLLGEYISCRENYKKLQYHSFASREANLDNSFFNDFSWRIYEADPKTNFQCLKEIVQPEINKAMYTKQERKEKNHAMKLEQQKLATRERVGDMKKQWSRYSYQRSR